MSALVPLLVPTSAVALTQLWDLLERLKEAIEFGDAGASEFFDDQARQGVVDPENPYLYPDLVRYRALHVLRPQMIALGASVEELPNIGLEVTAERGVRRYRIRVRKAEQGEIPSPGQSEALIDFYNQPQQLVLLPPADVHLVLFWEFEEPAHELRLWLAAPLTGGWSRSTLTVHWCELIPASTLPATAPSPEAEELEEDLPAEVVDDDDEHRDLPMVGDDGQARPEKESDADERKRTQGE